MVMIMLPFKRESLSRDTPRSGARIPRTKFLAQRCALSQDRSAMNRFTRSHSRPRALVATIIFAAFCWTLLGSVSPQLHTCIHGDASRSDHVCAITLIGSGSYENAAEPPLVNRPEFSVSFSATAVLTSTWVKPLFLNGHIFAHAPPAHS